MPTKKQKPSGSSKGKKTSRAKRAAPPAKKSIPPNAKAPSSRRVTPVQLAESRVQARVSVGDLGHVWADAGKMIQRLRVSCIRADDLLVCDFVFENLELDKTGQGAPKLVRANPNATTTLIVEFPPQCFGEEAKLDKPGESGQEIPDNLTGKEEFPEKYPNPEDEDAPEVPLVDQNGKNPSGEALVSMASIRIRMSGRSRIAFSMPANETELPFTIEAILAACLRWPMRLNVNAVPDPPPFHFTLPGLGWRDEWLLRSVKSGSWSLATESLVNTLGAKHKKSFEGAARRLSRKTIDAIRSGAERMDTTLRRAFDEELEILTRKSRSLRDSGGREMAAAALSMMTTEALAGYQVEQSVFEVFPQLPYLPMIFGPHKPAPNVTALELPYRLIISPVPQAEWHHETKPVVHNGRTELWHTRLNPPKKHIGPDEPTNIRALWSPDYPFATSDLVNLVNANLPFRMSMDPLDRQMLVRLMSGFDEENTSERAYRPTTSRARRLALSSLGALLDVEGSWQPPVPAQVGLEQWKHLATLGRDHYVRVVYRGYLCFPRHPASLIKVTERKFEFFPESGGNRNRVAVLRQKFFIVVRKPYQHYDGRGHIHDGLNFPFTDVEILTEVTPTLLAPDDPACHLNDPSIYVGEVPHRACFWPMIGTPGQQPANARNFMFQMAGTDRAGKRCTFAMPLLFIGVEANEAPIPDDFESWVMSRIVKAYNATPASPRRTAQLNCQSVCYAPPSPDPEAKGDPRMPTTRIAFKVATANVPIEEARFYPEMQDSDVGNVAMQRLLQQPNVSVTVKYAEKYKTSPGGFGGSNKGELFLTLLSPKDLAFGESVKSDSIGGLATPSMAILGFSRIMGPVAAKPPAPGVDTETKLGDIIANAFNPAEFFQGAKILGGVELKSILDRVDDLAQPYVPKLLSREYDNKIEASFDWDTIIKHGDEKDGKAGFFIALPNDKTTLNMHGVVTAPLQSAAEPTFEATATMLNFKVNLFGAVTLWFDKLVYRSVTGAKPDVIVDLHPTSEAIEFGGPLEFINEIKQIIPANGFSDPPFLNVTPSGISASYSINFPSLAVGIFALEHVSLGAGFLLPFDARPAEVRFNFAERQRPFSLTVSMLGGGGFFAIGLGAEGVREVEAALEFGAALSINLGVASGSVEIKAGVYFHWKTNLVELSGYVRLHGELSVLGLISASLTFNLALGYLKEGNKSVVWGEASIEVEIEVLFLSFSVSVHCRREFGGSNGDPKFIELVPDQATWNDYCEAFATEV